MIVIWLVILSILVVLWVTQWFFFLIWNKKDSSFIWLSAIAIIGLCLVRWFWTLIITEISWFSKADQCTGIVAGTTIKEDLKRNRQDYKSYSCIQYINVNNYFQWEISNKQFFQKDELGCDSNIGRSVSWYCNNNQFRQQRNSISSLIGIVILLWIFIFAGKLLYNHQQRKKKISS